MSEKMSKQEAGALGGKTTAERYGREYFSRIGKLGAETTWTRYTLRPTGTRMFAMVNRETGKIVAFHV